MTDNVAERQYNTALEQQREDAQLGAAWRRTDAALPEGWVMQLNIWRPEDWMPGTVPARVTASAGPNEGPEARWIVGPGDTPTAALAALADALEARNG